MKKVVGYILLIIVFISSIMVGYMLNNDRKYFNKMKDKIGLDNISYINKYNNYYLVLDNENLYLFNSDYEKIIELDKDKLCQNKNNYEIIYRDEDFQYLKDYQIDGDLVFEYVNIYNCKLIEKIVLGGV